MKSATTPGRFGAAASAAPDRREQRRLDQARGLVPFAVKLEGDLVKRIHAVVQERSVPLNDLVADLLRKGLDAK
jgi:hypothetical protein